MRRPAVFALALALAAITTPTIHAWSLAPRLTHPQRSLQQQPPRRTITRQRAAVTASTTVPLVVVLGQVGGVAQAVAHRLGQDESACRVRAVFDRSPPAATLPAVVDVVTGVDLGGDNDGARGVQGAVQGANVVVLAPDFAAEAKGEVATALWAALSDAVAQQPQLQAVVCLRPPSEEEAGGESSAASGGLLSGLFGGGKGTFEGLQTAAAQAQKQLVVLEHGALFGGIPGAEPVPFLTGPQLSPELDPHFSDRAVQLSRSGKLLAKGGDHTARTARMALAETVSRLVTGGAVGASGGMGLARRISVLSFPGAAPNDGEWDQLLARVDGRLGVELLSIAFDEVVNARGLLRFLQFSWAPKALRELPTYMRTQGSRPVQTEEMEDGVGVRWRDPSGQRNDGLVLVQLAEEGQPRLRVTRVDADGKPRPTPLDGDEELLQALVEAVEETVYAKEYAVRLGEGERLKAEATATALAEKAEAQAEAAKAATVEPETAAVEAEASPPVVPEAEPVPAVAASARGAEKVEETEEAPAAKAAPRRKRRSKT